MWASTELQLFPLYLANNLKIDLEKAQALAERLDSM